MPQNVGFLDRMIRFLVAAGLVAFGLLNVDTGLWWVGLIALVPLVTGLFRYCPIWHLAGIKTISVKKL